MTLSRRSLLSSVASIALLGPLAFRKRLDPIEEPVTFKGIPTDYAARMEQMLDDIEWDPPRTSSVTMRLVGDSDAPRGSVVTTVRGIQAPGSIPECRVLTGNVPGPILVATESVRRGQVGLFAYAGIVHSAIQTLPSNTHWLHRRP